VEAVGAALGIKSDDLDGYYLLKAKDLLSRGGSALLNRYRYNMFHLLRAVFPEVTWDPWRFRRVSKTLPDDPTVIHDAVKKVERILKIETAEEWYRVSMERLRGIPEGKAFSRIGLFEALRHIYPNFEWDERLLLSRGPLKDS